jgi:ATP-binding cassette subfamily B protein
MLGISDAAEVIGFRTIGIKVNFEKLATETPLPCIVHWKQNHFVVVYEIKEKAGSEKIIVSVADPAHGKINYTKEEFINAG